MILYHSTCSFSKNSLAPDKAMDFRKDMKELFEKTCKGFRHNVVVADVIKGILQVRSYL